MHQNKQDVNREDVIYVKNKQADVKTNEFSWLNSR